MDCPICGNSSNNQLLSVSNVPVSCAKLFVDSDDAIGSLKSGLNITVCLECAHIWNQSFQYPSNDLYNEDYYSSFTESQQARSYQENLASVLGEYIDLNGKNAVEIGCGDGFFLHTLMKMGASTIGYEPSSTYFVAKERPGLNVFHEFFNFEDVCAVTDDVDIVVMRHVLEHMADPLMVLKALKTTSFSGKPPSFLLLEVPNSHHLLKNDLYFDFYNDHVHYFSHSSLDELAYFSGWTPVYRSEEDEFLRVIWSSELLGSNAEQTKSINTDKKRSIIESSGNLREDFLSWKNSLSEIINSLLEDDKRVAVWGAGARGVSMLAGLGSCAEHFAYVIDSDPNKWGKFLPITGLEVFPKTQINLDPIDSLLVTSYTYFDEIFAQLGEFRSGGGSVIKIYPTPELKR